MDEKDCFFVSKEFLSMVERDELLEYALVYSDCEGVLKHRQNPYKSMLFHFWYHLKHF